MLKIRDIWRPENSLPETRDKIPQIRDFPYYTGQLATLASSDRHVAIFVSSNIPYRQQAFLPLTPPLVEEIWVS